MDFATHIRPFGLTQIYESPSPGVDIVFVHGLNGHPHRTWTSPRGTFWPVDLLPGVLGQSQSRGVRILTYGYNANVTSFTDGASKDKIHHHSETLAAQLAANRTIKNCTDRPIIFVCHSLGGLVVKRALIYSRSLTNEKVEHLRSIYVSTYGILFLGTPHNGSEVAKWGLLLQNICSAVLPKKFMESSPQLIKALKTNNETLQNINSLFTDMMPRFRIYFFHETLSTDFKGTRELIVDETSAAPYADGVERMGIEATHSHMCKFDDDNAPGYEAVAEALLRYSRDAPGTIQERWNEEAKTRMIIRTQKAREIFGDQTNPDRQSVETSLGGPSTPVQTYLPSTGKPTPMPSVENSVDLSLSRSWQDGPLWVVPPGFHRNATFVGMQKELDTIHGRLFMSKKRDKHLMSVLLAGVPGSGKSHIARQYVWTHRDDYPGGIFWVDAKSRQSTYKCFWDIAQAATLTNGQEFQDPDTTSASRYVDSVRHWLESREEWLLVFDGVSFNHDEEINEFKQFLPFKERCGIIYTSVDKTLRKKQRLYEPYYILVSPLQPAEACKLLFKDLGIRRPTKKQIRKATEVVTHYECLPLAIHAISHRLSATDKPIEKYHINSHLTDEKLAEPFLSIMHDLYRGEHFAALNLINLLSFLGHHVPVGLITMGKSFLEAWNIEVFTSSRYGERGDLDNTMGILIRYGLIERTSDKYPLLQTPSSPVSERLMIDFKAVIPDLSESQTESSQDGLLATYQSSGVSDIIKIHSVVQGFCRDELKIMDKDSSLDRPVQNAGFYDSWLVVATHLFCTSFEVAKCRMDRVDDGGSVKDYREYETHASQLMKNFPKRTAHGIVNDSLKLLKDAMQSIRAEIDRISPSSSQESIRKHRSVFDRSSSSSSFPDSTASDGVSRQLTLDFDIPLRSESPQDIRVSPHQVNLGPIIPHIFRKSTSRESEYLNQTPGIIYRSPTSRDRDDYLDTRDTGYLTDDESTRAQSPAMSQVSQNTERSKLLNSPQRLDDGWQVIDNPVKTRPKAKRSKSQPRRQRLPRGIGDVPRIGNSKPAAPVLERTPAEWRSVASDETIGERSPHRTASEALTAVSNWSPSQPSGYFRQEKKENTPTYAYMSSRMAEPIPKNQRSASSPGRRRPVFSELQPSSSRQRPVFTDLQSRASEESLSSSRYSIPTDRPEPMAQSTYSEPDHGLLSQLNALDLGTQYLGSQMRIVPADLSASTPILGLPYESNIEIKFSRRLPVNTGLRTPAFSNKSSTNVSTVQHPSAIMPGQSPPSSDPAPELMSRNPSGQSQQSWSTEPSRFPRLSPAPSTVSGPTQAQTQTQTQFIPVPQYQALSGAGSWVSDSQRQSASAMDTAFAPSQPQLQLQLQPQLQDPKLPSPSTLDPIWSNPHPQTHLSSQSQSQLGTQRIDLHPSRQRRIVPAGRQSLSQPQSQFHLHPHPQFQIYHDNRSGPLLSAHEFEAESAIDGGWSQSQSGSRSRSRSRGMGIGMGMGRASRGRSGSTPEQPRPRPGSGLGFEL
ncbi:hypothetical protein BJY04DRAFT_206782 [Aspergillus karnatakaensis]|uniref:LipA and NB-ARC domain protein n=1 Tax=Aspergillus karnatakaensis TaxID=1810916 RepID=UPI003CCDACD7